jgi:hypothetical protein
MGSKSTRDMSDRHEAFLAEIFGGRRTPGSGNQFSQQMDVRDSPSTPHAMAWDGKATLGKSVGVTREMWEKARQQAGAQIPALALRWYSDERLTVAQDLVVLDAHDFAAILEDARQYQRVKECLEQGHDVPGWPEAPESTCGRCGGRTGYLGEG